MQTTKQLRIEHIMMRNFRKINEIDNFDFDKLNSNCNINRQKNIEIKKQNDFQIIEKIRFNVHFVVDFIY